MAKSSSDNEVGIGCGFLIACAVASSFGVIGWAVLIGVGISIAIAISVNTGIQERTRREKEAELERAACVHGVTGAMRHPELCRSCVRAREQLEREAREKAAVREAQQESARQERYKQWQAETRLPSFLKTIHPRSFEELVASVYRQLGYSVTLTQYSNDGGVDAFAEKDGKRFLIQCKRFQGSVGQPILRDLYGAVHKHCADGGILVTTGKITEQAREWVKGTSLQIVEFSELQVLVEKAFPDGGAVPAGFVDRSRPENMCPNCMKRLVLRNGKRGKFYGCSGYPECRYTKNYK